LPRLSSASWQETQLEAGVQAISSMSLRPDEMEPSAFQSLVA
jgi:hypothetical protein